MSILLKPWLVLAGIFAIGIVTGSAITFALAPHFFPPPGERAMREHWLPFLNQRLNLTQEQRDKIKPIVQRASSDLSKLHGEEIDRGSKIFHDANEQILDVLTPQQRDLLKSIEHDHEAQRMHDMQYFFQPPRGNRNMMRRSGFDDVPPPPGMEGTVPMGNPGPRGFGNPPPPPDGQGPPPPPPEDNQQNPPPRPPGQ